MVKPPAQRRESTLRRRSRERVDANICCVANRGFTSDAVRMARRWFGCKSFLPPFGVEGRKTSLGRRVKISSSMRNRVFRSRFTTVCVLYRTRINFPGSGLNACSPGGQNFVVDLFLFSGASRVCSKSSRRRAYRWVARRRGGTASHSERWTLPRSLPQQKSQPITRFRGSAAKHCSLTTAASKARSGRHWHAPARCSAR